MSIKCIHPGQKLDEIIIWRLRESKRRQKNIGNQNNPFLSIFLEYHNTLHFVLYNAFFFFFQPLGASDYLQLCQAFHTIIIRNIPQLSLRNRSQARRFITLIDTLYDNSVTISYLKRAYDAQVECFWQAVSFQINLIATADVPIQELFLKNDTHHDHDEARVLMDDLNIHHAEV